MQNTMTELLKQFTLKPGVTHSPLPEVRFIRTDHSVRKTPLVYEPNIFILAQGSKRVYMGEEVLHYDPNHYLVMSVPLPLECETDASPEKPLLGISIKVDPATVGELLLDMDSEIGYQQSFAGAFSGVLTGEMTDAAVRLLRCIASERDCRILGPQIVREIIYRILCTSQGAALRALAVRHSNFSQIAKVLRRMQTEFDSEFSMDVLAREANMSLSAFHHNFKAVTSTSPLQYLKSIRLHKARLMMIQDGMNASDASGRVGYASPSQFSRDFKKLFGRTPASESKEMRTGLN
ncbi:AraC family transcriptional regulator [Seleniivibrio woodruffii]|uniref:AraC family transcriptional regulator n=1 Tax=Seleniivibrio woodruffii TaxID=1078050 RepID=UPI0026EC46AC|nr:AraC family transcriptional regulator [Seleniivibrio woodruffii]